MTEFGTKINVIWPRFAGGQEAFVEAPFTCDNCRRLSIGGGRSHADPNQYTDHDDRWGWSEHVTIWLPKVGVGREYPDVPKHIAPAASEAHVCQSIGAHRAAVMLARAVGAAGR